MPCVPGVPAPNLALRMASGAFRERGGVSYRTLESRSLLNRCSSARVPFDWTVNPYRGCALGCRYCYAAYTHEFMGIAQPEEFHSTVFVKRGAEAGTARALAQVVRRGELIALGAATDPYQPAEASEQVTRRFLSLVAQHRAVRLGITTKGALILRDLDLLRRIHGRSRLSVSVSLISPDAGLLRRVEPWAPTPEVRLEMMRRLVAEGLDVGLSMAPVLPGITDREADISSLLERVHATGVRRMSFAFLFLRSPTRERYLRWLAAEFPSLSEPYEQAYAAGAYLGGSYRRRTEAMIERVRQRFGLVQGHGPAGKGSGSAAQLGLWS